MLSKKNYLPWNIDEKYYAYEFEVVGIIEENIEKQGLKEHLRRTLN